MGLDDQLAQQGLGDDAADEAPREPDQVAAARCPPEGSEDGVNVSSVQRGQSVQPSPEPVSRTPAPVTTIATSSTSAAMVMSR